MSDDGLNDLLDGDDDHDDLGDQDDPIMKDIMGPGMSNTNKRLTLDMEINFENSLDLLNDDELEDDHDLEPELECKLESRKKKGVAKPLVIPPGLTAPPGLNIFCQTEGDHAFKYFSFDDLCLEEDFDYGRRPHLKGHGLSDQTIDNMLTDKFTFLRHLMPSAQSILICDKTDFKIVMDFLLYCVSVCPDRKMSDFLAKSFFDLAKNYAFYWRLTLKHVVTALLNYGIQDHAVEHCTTYIKHHRKKSESTKSTDTMASFLAERKRHKSDTKHQQPVMEDNKFSFCVSRFIQVVCELFVGMSDRHDFIRDKADWSELCAFAFLMNIIATDKRFVEDYLVLDSITTMYTYLFDFIQPAYWYSGSETPVKKDGRFTFTLQSFPRKFSMMVHDFPALKKMDPFRTWEKEVISTNFSQDVEHYKNMYHKIDLMPQSYRGNQVRKFLAYLYLHTLVQINKLNMLKYPDIREVVDIHDLMKTTCIKLLIKMKHFPYVLAIVKMWDIIVGNETEESFSADKIPAIKLVSTSILDLIDKKLPSPATFGTDKLQDLLEIKHFVQVVKERWNNGCGDQNQ
jgi:hypothetical protein